MAEKTSCIAQYNEFGFVRRYNTEVSRKICMIGISGILSMIMIRRQ